MEGALTFGAYIVVFIGALLFGARSVSRHHPALRQDTPQTAKSPQQ
ncbi:hypothetical protein AB4156_03060 [Cupriavidus sp. 2MCAB6]